MAGSIAIFLFAHQDDECGCLYEIHRLVSRGDKVFIAYLTSGSLDGSPSPIRDAESKKVLTRLGVDKSNIFFLGSEARIPDGRLSGHLEVGFCAINELIVKIGTPQRLYFLAWEGGHQDHDAVHLIGIVMAEQLGIVERCYQIPFYTGANLPSVFFRLFFPLPENGEGQRLHIPWSLRIRFVTLCFYYPSQIKTWLGLFPFFFVHYLFSGIQTLQYVSLKRIHEPPHSGVLLYERRQFYSYQRFVHDACGFTNSPPS